MLSDKKRTDRAIQTAIAKTVLEHFAGTSAKAAQALRTLNSVGFLSAKAFRYVLSDDEDSLKSRYEAAFGPVPEPAVVYVPIRNTSMGSASKTPIKTPLRRLEILPSPEDLSHIGSYITETSPTRRALAWAKEHDINLIPTNQYPDIPKSYSYYNPVQSEAIRELEGSGKNLIVSAPTSSGKTDIAIFALLQALRAGKRAIYLSPLRALSQEKYDSWTDSNSPFSKYKICLYTGDVHTKRVSDLEAADLIIITSEMLDSKSRSQYVEATYLAQVGALVCDEAHLIGVPNRGPRFEAALMRFTEIAPDARIILLSATLPNAQDLEKWLSVLSVRGALSIQSTFRPTCLDTHIVEFSAGRSTAAALTAKALQLISSWKEDQTLVFFHSKYHLREAGRTFSRHGISVGMHNADMPKAARNESEARFRDGSTQVLVATSTVAMGLNLPARRVIVMGTERGGTPVDVTEIQQECGRAGRANIDTKGDAYVLVPDSLSQEQKEALLQPRTVMSQLAGDDVLSFQIVAEIRNGRKTRKALDAWYKRSLYYSQTSVGGRVEARMVEALDTLINLGAISGSDPYQVEPLGQIAADQYYSPSDCAAWLSNILEAIRNPLSDLNLDLAWVIGNAPSYRCEYIPSKASGLASVYRGRPSQHSALPTILAIYSVLDGHRRTLASRGLLSFWLQIYQDLERLTHTLDVIQTVFVPKNLQIVEYESTVLERVRRPIPKRLQALMTVRGIGRDLAEKLFASGLTTPNNMLQHREQAAYLLGSQADNILMWAQEQMPAAGDYVEVDRSDRIQRRRPR